MITKDEAHNIAIEVVKECRGDIEHELVRIRQSVSDNAWTEDKARDLAERASDLAVKKITDDFYMGVGKKTVTALGAAVVATVIILRDQIKSILGLK